MPYCTEALGVVFNEVQTMGIGPRHECVHVGTLAKQVNHHHRFGLCCASALGRGRVDLEGVRMDVHKDGRGADFGHDFRS